MVYQERYKPLFMAANTSSTFTGSKMGGFLTKTAGTLTVTSFAGVVLVSAHPVSAGIYYPIPMYVGPDGATVALAGGASGTLLI